MSIVSLVRVGAHESDVRGSIGKCLDLIPFKLSANVKNVVIKPNLCYYWDCSTGETTDPRFVGALIDLLRERITPDITVSIMESDASAMKCRHAFRMLGYEKLAQKKKANLVNLTLDVNEIVEVKTRKSLFKFAVARTIKDADLFVNVPKMKYMPKTKISCALKNIYGCNPYPKKFKYHVTLDEVIVSLNKVIRPDLCLVDGIIVRGKYTKKLGLVMASSDSVAIDSTSARIMGLDPRRINHIVLAERAGLGKRNCKTMGESVGYFAQRFPRENARGKIQSALISLGVVALKKMGRYATGS